MGIANQMAFKSDRLSEKDRRRVAEFVTHCSGIQLPDSKQSLIESRLRKRQRTLGFSSLSDYVRYVFTSREGCNERIHLLDALTTNKTDFYRESNHFEFLRHYLEHAIRNHRVWPSTEPFRVWSAGCSTGEEPYTLAIELSEFQYRFPQFNFDILATDISVSSLETAFNGIYTMERANPIPELLRKRYLYRSKERSRNLVAMSEQLRRCIHFAEFNLLSNNYAHLSCFDIIFCRNVMIYFSNQDRANITRRFHHRLKPEGMLIVGHSESLVGNQELYQRLQPTIYQKK